MSDLENFAAVFAETLSPEDRERFETMLTDDPSPKTIFDIILASHVAVLKPPFFVRTGDKELISRAAFDMQYNPVVNLIQRQEGEKDYRDQASKRAIAGFDLRRASAAVYEPGQPSWIGNRFNMWRDPGIEPLAETPEIFLDHINYLIPDPVERKLFLDFLAWMVQHPDKKLMFALLIVGRGGTGKSWLGKLFEIMFGIDNVSKLEKDDPLLEQFNGYAENKRLIFIDELVPNDKMDLAKKIAGLITEARIWIRRMYIERFQVPNRANLIAISNYPNALKLARTDRRWGVIRATEDYRFSDDNNKPTDATFAYYDRLHAVTPDDGTVTDEVRRVLWYLGERDLSDFKGQAPAPATETKDDIADLSESNILSQVQTLYHDGAAPFCFGLVTVNDVMGELSLNFDDTKSRKTMEAEVASAMEQVGCRRIRGGQVYSTKFPGGRARLWATGKAIVDQFQGEAPAELVKAYFSDRDLAKLMA